MDYETMVTILVGTFIALTAVLLAVPWLASVPQAHAGRHRALSDTQHSSRYTPRHGLLSSYEIEVFS